MVLNMFYVHPENWRNDSIWRYNNIFQMGLNHQLDMGYNPIDNL